jgi:hypothetical protein
VIVAARALAGLAVAADPPRIYVPNSESDTVDVVSQATGQIVRHCSVGAQQQHVTPSWDLRTLWVTNDRGNSLTPIDPRTGRPGHPVAVADPYNLYFTADGRRAIAVAEARHELDFRSPHTMRLRHALRLPRCAGVDHMDFTASGRLALVSCEFATRLVVVKTALGRQALCRHRHPRPCRAPGGDARRDHDPRADRGQGVRPCRARAGAHRDEGRRRDIDLSPGAAGPEPERGRAAEGDSAPRPTGAAGRDPH